MTREEAIAVLNMVEAHGSLVIEAKDMAIKALEQEPSSSENPNRWIPCSERLPDTDDYVLCWYEYYHWSQEKVLPEYGLGCYLKETSAWFGEVANGSENERGGAG